MAIDLLIDRMDLRCTKCGAPRSVGCSCWTKCSCGRTYEAGGECPNPIHQVQAAADELAADAVRVALRNVARSYPVQMKTASGGFRRTLKVAAERVISNALTTWMMSNEPADRAPPSFDFVGVLLGMKVYYPGPIGDEEFRAALRGRLEREAEEIAAIWARSAREGEP